MTHSALTISDYGEMIIWLFTLPTWELLSKLSTGVLVVSKLLTIGANLRTHSSAIGTYMEESEDEFLHDLTEKPRNCLMRLYSR